jgi:hypothetical protein
VWFAESDPFDVAPSPNFQAIRARVTPPVTDAWKVTASGVEEAVALIVAWRAPRMVQLKLLCRSPRTFVTATVTVKVPLAVGVQLRLLTSSDTQPEGSPPYEKESPRVMFPRTVTLRWLRTPTSPGFGVALNARMGGGDPEPA